MNKKNFVIPFFTSKGFFISMEFGGGFALFVAFSFFVFRFQFAPIGAMAVPLIAVFYGFASLLYNRSRAYSKGPVRIRSLYAAERAIQATIFALVGLIVGVGMYGFFAWYGFTPDQEISAKHGLLFLFIFPHCLIQAGYQSFMISLKIAGKEYLRHIPPRQLTKKIKSSL